MTARSDEHIRAKCFHPSGMFIEFPKQEIDQTITERFEKIARRFPDRTAVETTRHRLSYRDLNRAANRTAHALSACGDHRGSVAILMEQDAPVASAILGTLKAGKFYVPLDPSLPYARSKLIVDDTQAEFILTNSYRWRSPWWSRQAACSTSMISQIFPMGIHRSAWSPTLFAG